MRLRVFLVVAVLFLTFTLTKTTYAQSPFSECSSRTGASATLTIPEEATPSVDEEALPEGAEIAAFTDEGVCAGHVVWEGENTALVVWGDDSQTEDKDGFEAEEPITLRIWDPETDEVYENDEITVSFSEKEDFYVTEQVFRDGGIYVLDELSVEVEEEVELSVQEVSLTEGWNIVAIHLELEERGLEAVFEDVIDDIVLIKNSEGEVFSPEFGIDDIDTWEEDEAYWVYAGAEQSFTLEGEQLDPTASSIELTTGWVLVPFTGEEAVAVEEWTGSIDEEFVLVQDADGAVYFPDYSIDDIQTVAPGQGYLVYLQDEATLTLSQELGSSAGLVQDR